MTYTIPKETFAHFNNIPWCRPTLQDADFKPTSMSRTITHNGTGHTLMAQTWNTDSTIKHLLSFYRTPSPTKKGLVRRLYTFGNGLNAHPGLLHGGVIAAILDSTMGNAVGMGLDAEGPMYTVQLNTAYKKPVRTPGTVMAESWIKQVEDGGRKVWVEGILRSQDERGEVVHATAEGLWIGARAKI